MAAQPAPVRAITGSFRAAAHGATLLGPAPPAEPVTVTLVLRRRAEPPAGEPPAGEPQAAEPLTREQLADRYGAHPDDIATVRRVLDGAGLPVVTVDPAARLVRVRGTVAALCEFFGVELTQVQLAEGGRARHRTGEIRVPAELADVLVAVLGLDDRPAARIHLRAAADQVAALNTSYTPTQLARIYGFPPADGTGTVLGLIELGGGYTVSDLTTYFGGLGVPMPTVTAIGVDGATNDPGTDTNADGEVMLDIEVAGAIAPAAAMKVYFAPNTDAGFVDAIAQAAHDTPAPTAISISWGQSEDAWTGQARTAMDQALQDATLLGISVTVAAGDNGSADGVSDGAPHVDFPASSPHALACGGTSLRADPSTGVITAETVWNDGSGGGATGGGISDVFALPSWQAGAGVPGRAASQPAPATAAPTPPAAGRGVPDVAGNADPETGYQVLVDGQRAVYGGTSAVAPLWAALICRIAQGRPGLGLLQPTLYATARPGVSPPGFRDITQGSNGAYSAGPGWDACSGLGVPVGADLAAVLTPIAPKP